jgi:hypothetical protein
MKHILAILILCTPLYAADVVVVTSATSVTVNGEPAGKPVDTMRNRPELASAIQVALETWAAEEAAKLAKAQSDLSATLARRSELINLAKAKLAELPADARAVVSNVVAQAELPEKEALRLKIQADIAAKQAELNKLTQ